MQPEILTDDKQTDKTSFLDTDCKNVKKNPKNNEWTNQPIATKVRCTRQRKAMAVLFAAKYSTGTTPQLDEILL